MRANFLPLGWKFYCFPSWDKKVFHYWDRKFSIPRTEYFPSKEKENFSDYTLKLFPLHFSYCKTLLSFPPKLAMLGFCNNAAVLCFVFLVFDQGREANFSF